MSLICLPQQLVSDLGMKWTDVLGRWSQLLSGGNRSGWEALVPDSTHLESVVFLLPGQTYIWKSLPLLRRDVLAGL